MKTKLLSAILAVLMLISTLSIGMTVNAADLTYSDVTENMWSYGDIVYVTENGLMNGTGGTTFSPSVSLTRAMVVTVLYRMEGSPRVEFKDLFLDVKDRLYYSEAVIWAKMNGIVTATSTSEWGEECFSPDRDITRQELATMFVRFADYKNIDLKVNATLDKFTDKAQVADWASDAMKWATSVGLINGTGNGSTLSPTGKATREQFAAIIHRFATTDFEYKIAYAQPKPLGKYTEPPYPLVDNADVYVAVDGSDKNPGTKDKPLATFEAARDKVRELKKTAKDEIVVAFKAGDYGSLNNVTFTAEDTGTENVPIKYCKYGDGEVKFHNGIYIYEEEFTLVEGEEAKIFKKDSRPYIYKADLSGKIDNFGLNTRLFTETGIGTEAREPNSVYYTNMTTTVDDHASIKLLIALPAIAEKFSSYENLKVNGFLRTGWLVDCFPVKSYDKETAVLTFDFEKTPFDNGYDLDEFPLMYEGRTDDLIFFSNLPEFLDTNGEYWFDNKTSTLYVYRAKGDYAIDGGGEFITIEKGADYLSLVGLDFSITSKDAITVKSNYFTLDRCKIGNVGGDCAVNAKHGIHDFTVKNCELYNFVSNGIVIISSSNMMALQSGNNVIVNNYIHDFTLPQYFSAAIEIMNDVGTYIAHNEFYEGGHGAVKYNGTIGVIIEYNVFDRIMTKTQDFGAIYTGRYLTYCDNVTRYNIFSNIPVYSVYLDDGSGNQEVYGNIFYKAGIGVTQNGGRCNRIHDNIFIQQHTITSGAGLYTCIVEGKPEDLFESDAYHKLTTLRPDPGTEFYDEWYKRWPFIYDYSIDPDDVGKENCLYSTVTYLENNVQINNGGFEIPEMTKQFGIEKNNKGYKTNENPFFANPAAGDYTIVKDIDNFTNPYDFSKIGRY